MNIDNWQQWHYFVAIAEHGSLQSAAKSLSISQPTLSRQLFALEQSLGQSLFDRSTQGLTLTNFGSTLLEEAQAMQTSAITLERLAQGQEQVLEGTVRLSVNELIAQYYLAPLAAKFYRAYPGIHLIIDVSNRVSNIEKRDTDIAIRMFKPTQSNLVCCRLGEIKLGFYATDKYLEHMANDVFKTVDGMQQLALNLLIGPNTDEQFIQAAKHYYPDFNEQLFNIRTDFMPLHLELACHDLGIALTHSTLAQTRNLTQISTPFTLPGQPVYLACHKDIQHNPRIKATMDFLINELPQTISLD